MARNLSRNAMALLLDRSPKGVGKAITRLKIEPTEFRGTRPLYAPAIVETLRTEMRAPNHKPETAEG